MLLMINCLRDNDHQLPLPLYMYNLLNFDDLTISTKLLITNLIFSLDYLNIAKIKFQN